MSHNAVGSTIRIITPLAVLIVGWTIIGNGQSQKQSSKALNSEGSSSTGVLLLAHAEKDVIGPGQPLNLTLNIKNVSTRVRFILETSATEEYRLIVQDERGAPVSLTEYGKTELSHREDHFRRFLQAVKPKEESHDVIQINKLYEMASAGTYSITAWRVVYDKNLIETGSVRSNTVEVKVIG